MNDAMMRLANIVTLTCSLSACGKDISRAHYTSYLNDSGNNTLVAQVERLEVRAKDDFMHDKNGFHIDIKYALLSEDTIGLAEIESDYSCTITIDSELAPSSNNYDEPTLRLVMLHEIGHCFGLDHTDDKSDIMYPYNETALQDNEQSFERFFSQLQSSRYAR